MWPRKQEEEDACFPDDERRGLLLSCLLRLRETDARCSREKARSLEEEFASPSLKGRKTEVKEEKMREGEIKEEGVRCSSVRASTGEEPFLRRGVFNLMGSHHLPVPSHMCFLSSRPASHLPTCLATFLHSAARCLQLPWLQCTMRRLSSSNSSRFLRLDIS